MASKHRKALKNSRNKADSTLAQFGILNIPDLNNMDEGDEDSDGGDEDLENELQAILGGKVQTKPSRPPRKAVANVTEVEKMAAACMKEVSIDEDENLSDDEELLSELHTLIPEVLEPVAIQASPVNIEPSTHMTSVVELLHERLQLYQKAQAASKVCGDSSRARRYGRSIKTLEELIKTAKAGQPIEEDSIPPPVAIPKPKPAPNLVSEIESSGQQPSISPPPPPQLADQPLISQVKNDNDGVATPLLPTCSIATQLASRRDQYKMAALKAKKAGDIETAMKYVRTAKKFDSVIEAEKNGEPIDLSNMPPPPPGFDGNAQVQSLQKPEPQKVQTEQIQHSPSISAFMDAALAAASEPQDASDIFGTVPPPKSILEALEQRLQKFISTRDTAKTEGNSSKARRINRIVQQYETAIRDHKAGKTVVYDELPTPPGFAPIPTTENSSNGVSPAKMPARQAEASQSQKGLHSLPASSIKEPQKITNSKDSSSGKGKLQRANTSSILEKQLNFLLERQKLFRQAALESKKNGDIQQAKEYLRMSKGFDSMIEASRCGLPIDATSIPTPPQLESDFVIIDKSACSEEFACDGLPEIYSDLEKDMQRQIEVCDQNKEHFLRLGDVTSASKFEKLGLTCKKDLAVIQYAWKDNQSIPKFHYETRLFSMVQCHTDLGDNDMEIIVERGINLPGKSDDLDSYVRLELPLPPDTPHRTKTHTVKNTNNPVFQENFKFEFNRKSRSIVRHFKRQCVKLEVWSKGGFLRGDTLLGTASVKLVELETKCTIHNSFDLMDGRKACGGKLEVKIRIRDPLLVKQVEEVKEKWLIIGS